jgi:3'(2'), 5'-bisphosphate nucleotidase
MGNSFSSFISPLISIIAKAGDAIMNIYNTPFNTEYKHDNTPLTLADTESNSIIIRGLKEISPYPVLSEEKVNAGYEERKNWDLFWLVDPLDGTKEFVKRNGEFSVNIALIEKETPVLGLIYLPVQEILYFAIEGMGAYRISTPCPPSWGKGNESYEDLIAMSERLPIKENKKHAYTVAVSRSHLSAQTEEFINKKKEIYPDVQIIQAGSAFKFCLVAEGKADAYPRFGPTMEWDTGAGHIIVNESGKNVWRMDTNEVLKYNKQSLVNPNFVVS